MSVTGFNRARRLYPSKKDKTVIQQPTVSAVVENTSADISVKEEVVETYETEKVEEKSTAKRSRKSTKTTE